MEGPVVVAPHQPCAMPMVSLEVPFAPGATIVLSSRRRDDEQDASAITPDVPMPPWVSKLLSEEEKFDVQSGVLLFWKGHLNDNFRERKRRKEIILRVVLLCCGLVCLAGGITGSVVRNGVTELQLLYFGAIIFTVLGTCAFASIAVVCIRQHPPDDQVPVVWTPVTAAEALGKSRELVNYLIVASRSCFWCRRLTLPDETGVMHVQLLWNDIVQHVLLCQDCMVKYLESGSEGVSTSTEPTCAICLELLGEKIVCKSCENRHLFHVHCVEQWFEHAPNRSCPVCRGVI